MIRPHILRMSAYKPPLEGRSGKGFLLLDFNERTRPVPPAVKDALIRFIEEDRLHVYPEYGDVLEKLAAYVGVAEDELMITNGSDQGIDIIFRGVSGERGEAIVPLPTFDMLRHSAELCGLQVVSPLYSRDKGYPFDEVIGAISERTRIVVVCNPNSPTGSLLPKGNVLEIARAAPHAAVLVDECYFEFSGTTVKDHINELPNLFITRTFSKTWGLSALRLGYVISCEANIGELLKIRGPYDMNKLAVVAAEAALAEPEFMHSYVREVVEEARPMLLNELEALRVPFWPTEANFVLLQPPDGEALTKELHDAGILVRPRKGPGIEGSVRITIGAREDMEKVIRVLRARYGGSGGTVR